MHHTESFDVGSMRTVARLCVPVGAIALMCCVGGFIAKNSSFAILSLIVALASSGVILAQLGEHGRLSRVDEGFSDDAAPR